MVMNRAAMLRATGPLAVVAAFGFMLVWSWGCWPDPIVDFGRELYVPWRLTEGDALYRDIAYFNGPLSPYVNALWFRLFGVGLRTLAVANLAILALLVGLAHHLCRIVSDRFTAAVACIVLVTLFGFAQLMPGGNFNYVCPYSHELTHGLLLAFGALACFAASRRSPTTLAPRIGCGLALGLLSLTKPEVFAATALALAGAALIDRRGRGVRTLNRTGCVCFVTALIAPIAIAFLLLARLMPAGDAMRGVLGAWPWVLRGDVATMHFFRTMTGLDHPVESLARIGRWGGGYLLLFGPIAAAALLLRRPRLPRRSIGVAGFALVAAVLTWLPMLAFGNGLWANFAQPIPLFLLACLCILTLQMLGRAAADRSASPAMNNSAVALALAIFAAVMLVKVALDVHLWAYGFAHAMPAVLLLVVALVGWAPAWIDRRGGCGGLMRGAAMGAVMVAVVTHVQISRFWFAGKTEVVGRGVDAFRCDAHGAIVRSALAQIERDAPADQTVLVLPEGVMLNYLARRRTPTRYVNFIPPELLIFGEAEMLAAIKAHPPDEAVVVHRETAVYGPALFGRDYARPLAEWLAERYAPSALFGAMPLHDRRFGILLMRPKPAASAGSQ